MLPYVIKYTNLQLSTLFNQTYEFGDLKPKVLEVQIHYRGSVLHWNFFIVDLRVEDSFFVRKSFVFIYIDIFLFS